MADEKGPDVMADALWFLGILIVLVTLWYFAGGPGKADLRGLFLAPPAPLGSGEAYGPDFGTTTLEAPQNLDESQNSYTY